MPTIHRSTSCRHPATHCCAANTAQMRSNKSPLLSPRLSRPPRERTGAVLSPFSSNTAAGERSGNPCSMQQAACLQITPSAGRRPGVLEEGLAGGGGLEGAPMEAMLLTLSWMSQRSSGQGCCCCARAAASDWVLQTCTFTNRHSRCRA
jgi:hypothetical protein